MRVAAWMKRDVVAVDPEQSLLRAEALMQRHATRHLPVVRKGRLVGILTDGDLQAAKPSPATTLLAQEVSYHLWTMKVREVMARDVVTVAPATPLAQAARLMRDRNIGALPVLKDGELVGILTDAGLMELLESLLRDDGDPGPRFPEEW
ncbi:MAG TPA: CBS domain-containing protein [Candidatus Sulfotelmatobacter sp.]|nr:CBS domain-containing protein [Candidatus Sulfotelmatobacter sp.]